MNPADPVVTREIPVIQKIIQDETWLEGERRGCYVRPDDRVVRERVCQVILRVGQELRETFSASGPALQKTLSGGGPIVMALPANVTVGTESGAARNSTGAGAENGITA
jgi:hypothetical protein